MSKYTKKQIRENRKAWVAALRSGKYKQTTGKLKSRNGSYCCLGVLCEVAEISKVYDGVEYTYGDQEALDFYKQDMAGEVAWNSEPEDYYMRTSSTDLPLAAREWLGVKSEAPRLAKPVTIVDKDGYEHEESSLISLNDDYCWTFEQIAEAVEKNGLRDD